MPNSTTRQLLAFGTIAAISALAACGGGGGSSAPAVRATAAPIVTAPPAGGGLAPASFSVKIPGPTNASVSRRTQAVNATTTTMSFALIKTDATGVTVPQNALTFDVSAGSALCTTGAAGARSCTLGLNAPIGNDVYSVQTLDVHGNKLSSSAVTIKVAQNVASSASISLGGTVAGVLITSVGVTFSFEGPSVVLDAAGLMGPASVRALVIGFDSQGNVILTPDTFSTPINLVFQNAGEVTINTGSHSRRPRVVAGAPAAVSATVIYANPNGGAASDSRTDQDATPLVITSPNDIVTLTALAPGPAFATGFTAIAAVGTPPSPLPAQAPTPPPNGLANTLSGFPFAVAPGAPAPPPPPPPPAAMASITWSADQAGMSAVPPQEFQFVNAQAAGATITLKDSNADGTPATGTITISSPSWNVTPALCAMEFASPDGSALPMTLPLAPDGTATFLLQTFASGGASPAPAPVPDPPPSIPPATPTPFPTGGLTCHLIATDGHGTTSTLTVDVNNPTGSIQ